MHLAEPSHVPKFGGEIAAFFDLFFVEANILAARRDPHQAEAQTVRAIFVDQVERIGRIAQRLRHFAALLVANDPGEENVVERNIVFSLGRLSGFEFKAGDDHARDPEENNVRSGYEHAGWVKFLSRFRIHRLVSPEPRRKPGIERVFVLRPTFSRRLNTDDWSFN